MMGPKRKASIILDGVFGIIAVVVFIIGVMVLTL